MKSINKAIVSIYALLSGVTFSSLLIHNSNTWKYTLCVFMIIVSIKAGIDSEKE